MTAVLLVALLGPAAHAQRDATITVHPQAEIGKVNRLVFGNNMLAYQDSREQYGNRGAGIWDPDKRRPVAEYAELSRLAGVTVHRWPGGCGAHNYNWKLTVGPLDQRPSQQFGLPEFLAFCEATDAIPLLTVAVYWGSEQDAADLVEYLNAPEEGANPNGGEDWAALRAADGHPAPYRVQWFEYGNESYHGEHKSASRPEPRCFSAQDYSQRYLKYRSAMRAVDPSVKLGALIQNGMPDWNKTVLQVCGRHMDFAIEHTYTPGHRGDTDDSATRPFMQACLASDARIQTIYDGLNSLIEESTGRTDIPLAITEYNGWFVQSKPVPYRQALANALRNAEHLRIMLRPANRVLMANFWQFSNEYWGMVRGYVDKGEPLIKQANFFPFELYAQHFGDTLIKADVECETWDFEGAARIEAREGTPTQFTLWDDNLLPRDYVWEDRPADAGIKQRIDGKTAVAEFPGEDVNYYFPRVELPVRPSTWYRVTALVKTENLTGTRGAGLQVGDARGWLATKSCSIQGDVLGSGDWTEVTVDYRTLPDTEAIEILARRLEGGGPVSGKAHYRLISVYGFTPTSAGAVPDLGVNCAKRNDGTVTVMVVNKNIDSGVPVHIRLGGAEAREGAASAWVLSGPTPSATNLGAEREIGVEPRRVDVRDGAYYLVMPACSMAAVEIAK